MHGSMGKCTVEVTGIFIALLCCFIFLKPAEAVGPFAGPVRIGRRSTDSNDAWLRMVRCEPLSIFRKLHYLETQLYSALAKLQELRRIIGRHSRNNQENKICFRMSKWTIQQRSYNKMTSSERRIFGRQFLQYGQFNNNGKTLVF